MSDSAGSMPRERSEVCRPPQSSGGRAAGIRLIQHRRLDVSKALIASARCAEFRIQHEALVTPYRDAARLFVARYRGVVTTFLEVLDSERNVYCAELTMAWVKLNGPGAIA